MSKPNIQALAADLVSRIHHSPDSPTNLATTVAGILEREFCEHDIHDPQFDQGDQPFSPTEQQVVDDPSRLQLLGGLCHRTINAGLYKAVSQAMKVPNNRVLVIDHKDSGPAPAWLTLTHNVLPHLLDHELCTVPIALHDPRTRAHSLKFDNGSEIRSMVAGTGELEWKVKGTRFGMVLMVNLNAFTRNDFKNAFLQLRMPDLTSEQHCFVGTSEAPLPLWLMLMLADPLWKITRSIHQF